APASSFRLLPGRPQTTGVQQVLTMVGHERQVKAEPEIACAAIVPRVSSPTAASKEVTVSASTFSFSFSMASLPDEGVMDGRR
ncbi:MAG TPA: hypothetical protein VHG35_15160, partial [Gemmatimonadales bacterium]|nr:hypothetical protein [Gemmatimonadales bacterium]